MKRALAFLALAAACASWLDAAGVENPLAGEPELIFHALGRDPGLDALRIPLTILERADHPGIRQIEISVTTGEGEQILRALFDAPSGSFGVCPMDESGEDAPVVFAVAGADLTDRRAVVLKESTAVVSDGEAEIMWVIRPRDWPAGAYHLFARVIGDGREDSEWQYMASFLYDDDHVPVMLVP